jgi:hypothetical protein
MQRNLMQRRLFVLALLVVLLITGSISAGADSSSPDAVLAWNTIAQRTAIQVGAIAGPWLCHDLLRAAAVYDAVMAIEGGYEPYALDLDPRPDASVDAAVATAAHNVLVHHFPSRPRSMPTTRARRDPRWRGEVAGLGGPGSRCRHRPATGRG